MAGRAVVTTVRSRAKTNQADAVIANTWPNRVRRAESFMPADARKVARAPQPRKPRSSAVDGRVDGDGDERAVVVAGGEPAGHGEAAEGRLGVDLGAEAVQAVGPAVDARPSRHRHRPQAPVRRHGEADLARLP